MQKIMTNIKTVANVDVLMKKLTFKYSLTTLLLIPVFVYLGFWQIDRYHEKQNQQRMLENRMHAPVMKMIPTSDVRAITSVRPYRYRQLEVIGHFLNERQIYLDNQIVKGRVGYRVLTPFQPIGQSDILLIDRGWIPIGKSRDEMPLVKPVLGQQTLIGTINLPTNGIQLSNLFNKTQDKTMSQISWPLRVQRIDFENLASLLSQKLTPFILQLNPQDSIGFNIQPITFNPPPSRHLGYAIQWFAMALAVLIYYLVINTARKQKYGYK